MVLPPSAPPSSPRPSHLLMDSLTQEEEWCGEKVFGPKIKRHSMSRGAMVLLPVARLWPLGCWVFSKERNGSLGSLLTKSYMMPLHSTPEDSQRLTSKC